MTHFACDLCGENSPIEIEVCRQYTGGQPIHVCSNCGLVYVTERRSSEEVAASWSEIYADKRYDPAWPAVEARLTYVAEFVKQSIGVADKSVLDIGAGDGRLLTKIDCANRIGVEPTAAHPPFVGEWFQGTAEQAVGRVDPADIVLLTWTLENCAEPRKVLDAVYKLTKPGGHIVVATGSRILVPPKKRLSQYLSTNAADTHPTRWSANTLREMLYRVGFAVEHGNNHEDSDWLVVIARRSDPEHSWSPSFGDDPQAVIDFFTRWHETWP